MNHELMSLESPRWWNLSMRENLSVLNCYLWTMCDMSCTGHIGKKPHWLSRSPLSTKCWCLDGACVIPCDHHAGELSISWTVTWSLCNEYCGGVCDYLAPTKQVYRWSPELWTYTCVMNTWGSMWSYHGIDHTLVRGAQLRFDVSAMNELGKVISPLYLTSGCIWFPELWLDACVMNM